MRQRPWADLVERLSKARKLRRHALLELRDSEKSYLAGLSEMERLYHAQVRADLEAVQPVIKRTDENIVFGQVGSASSPPPYPLPLFPPLRRHPPPRRTPAACCMNGQPCRLASAAASCSCLAPPPAHPCAAPPAASTTMRISRRECVWAAGGVGVTGTRPFPPPLRPFFPRLSLLLLHFPLRLSLLLPRPPTFSPLSNCPPPAPSTHEL